MEVNVRAVRTELGLTQPELGQLLGVSPITISKWETGEPSRMATVVYLALQHLLHLHNTGALPKLRKSAFNGLSKTQAGQTQKSSKK